MRRLLGFKVKPRRPTFMWEILNVITPSGKPHRPQDPRDYYDQIAHKRVDEVFPPEKSEST